MEIAQAKMEQLHQNSTTATEYFTVLDALNCTTGYDETTLIQLLKRGIEQPVIEKIYGQAALPTDYKGWKEAAI